ARGAIHGLTRATGPADFARAALESVGYQTRDLLLALQGGRGGGGGAGLAAGEGAVLRVDGGMVASDWTMQFLADILGAPVDRPVVRETTALGAAYLAGLQGGVGPGAEGVGWLAARGAADIVGYSLICPQRPPARSVMAVSALIRAIRHIEACSPS